MRRHYEIYDSGRGTKAAIPLGFAPAALTAWIWAFALRLWVEGVAILAVNFVFLAVLYTNHAPRPAYVVGQLLLGVITGLNARRLREMALERSGFSYLCTVPARGRADALARLAQLGGEPLPEWRARMLGGVPDIAPKSLRGLLAIATLTVRSAFRNRLVVAVLGLLLVVVLVLPGLIKHDGSARGFTQILITYTLGSITVLLGFTTLWLGCSSIARDIEEMQLFLVAAKPLPRWQIWLGKWLGIMAVNAAMVGIAGTIVYGLVLARTGELSEREQRRLKAEILVARASAREPAADISADVEQAVDEKMRQEAVSKLPRDLVKRQIEGQFKAMQEYVPPGHFRRWNINLGSDAQTRLKNRTLFVRVKFYTPQANSEGKTYIGRWQVGPPEGNRFKFENSLAAESYVEFPVPPNLADASGKLTVDFENWNDIPLLFPVDDGLTVLYPEGSFLLNYARGLCVIVAWLGLLTSIGLAGSSVFSFPVAAFVSLGALVLGLSGNTLKSVVEQGGIVGVNHETGVIDHPDTLNQISVAVYGSLKNVLDHITSYSPVGNLSSGLSITWGDLAGAIIFINLIMGGVISLIGISALTRRELAAPTKF